MVNYEKRFKCISREESVIFFCSAVVTWLYDDMIYQWSGGWWECSWNCFNLCRQWKRKVPQLVIWNVTQLMMMMTRKGSSCDCVGVIPQFGSNINSCVFCSVPKRINQLFNRSSVWVRGNIYHRSNLWRDNKTSSKWCYDQICTLLSYENWVLSFSKDQWTIKFSLKKYPDVVVVDDDGSMQCWRWWRWLLLLYLWTSVNSS